jgi:hypothetical protein
MGFVCLHISLIRGMLKVICVMAFNLLGANAVWAQSSLKARGEVASASQITINEPLLLLLFGVLLFSVATGIKLMLIKR